MSDTFPFEFFVYNETYASPAAPESLRLLESLNLRGSAEQILTQPSVLPASPPPPRNGDAVQNPPTQDMSVTRPAREDLPQGLQNRVLPLTVRQEIWEKHFADYKAQEDTEPLQLQIPQNKAFSLLIPEIISHKATRGWGLYGALPEVIDIIYQNSTDQRFGFTLLYVGLKRGGFPHARGAIMALRVAWEILLPWANLVNEGYDINVVKWVRWQTLNDNSMMRCKILDTYYVMPKTTYYVKDKDNLHDAFDARMTLRVPHLEDQHRAKRARVTVEYRAEKQSDKPDLREDPHHYDVGKILQLQWPSEPFKPSPLRAQISGIDCLAILYRFLHAGLPRGQWPPVEPGAADQAVLQYFWADFGKMEDDVSCRDQLRQAALAQIQGTIPGASVDFAALCESPAMMEAIWARSEFRLYGTVCSRPKGGFAWAPRPNMQTPSELASMGRLDWNLERHPVLQDFVNQMGKITKEMPTEDGSVSELMWMINGPLVVQIRLTVRRGMHVSLNNAQRFTAVSMRPGEFDPLVEGQARLYTYSKAETHQYILAAVVRTRNAESGTDYDAIRLFGTDGRERVPSNADEIAGRESWGGTVEDALPAGETFLLFYRKVPESMLGCSVYNPRMADTRAQTAFVDRKLVDDQIWWRGLCAYASQPPRAYCLTNYTGWP